MIRTETRTANPPGTTPLIDLVVESATKDDDFRRELLIGAVEAFANGDLVEARLLLRGCVAAGVGFATAAESLGRDAADVERMLTGGNGVDRGDLAALIEVAKSHEGLRFVVTGDAA